MLALLGTGVLAAAASAVASYRAADAAWQGSAIMALAFSVLAIGKIADLSGYGGSKLFAVVGTLGLIAGAVQHGRARQRNTDV